MSDNQLPNPQLKNKPVMTDETPIFQSIDRSNIVDSIISQFQVALMNGELRPGQRLPSESELCRHLGVGRSTLREAVKALTTIGVLEVRRGDGTYVNRQITPGAIMPLLFAILVESESPKHLQEFRFIFENGYFKLLAQRGKEEDFAAIKAAIDKMDDYIAAGGNDPEVLARLDLDFHMAAVESIQNPLILKVGHLLHTMLFEVIKRNMTVPGSGAWTVDRHRYLLDLMAHGKIDELEMARLPGPTSDGAVYTRIGLDVPPWRRLQFEQSTTAPRDDDPTMTNPMMKGD
jgi:GntR family transcriptional repressor for pyruvate dehydrogenase complex